MRETDTHYFFFKHQFGQWTLRDIIDRNGITYNCCEQYMMYHKALLFEDEEIAEKIMNTDSPHDQKKLGREVSDFDISIWKQYCFMIVWEGNFLKFTQHKDLQERLIMTQGKELVEASPYDKVWGVGLAADDDKIIDPSNWKGKNLLGKVLTSVREAIINSL